MNMITPFDFSPKDYSPTVRDEHMAELIDMGAIIPRAGDMAQDDAETEEPGPTWIHAALFTGVMLGIGFAITAITQ